MPDRCTDEETEREHLLCLLDFEGGDVPNRCSRCPNAPTAAGAAGATRLTLQRRRCPRDDLLASAFHAAADPDRKIRDESKSSASSSKLLPSLPQETSSHETDGEPVVDNLAQMSLTDAHATSTPDVSLTRAAPCEKRKAVLEPESQAKLQKKVLDLEYEFSGLAVKERLQNKPQILFRDVDFGIVPGCRRVSEACWTSMMKESLQDARLIMAPPLENQPAATTSYAGPSGSFVAGCNVNTETTEGRGVFACNDGIETGVLAWPDETDCDD